MLPLEYQPSDALLALVLSHHKRKCADYIDLKKVLSAVDASERPGPKRIANTPFFWEDPAGKGRKTSDVNASPS